MQLQGRRRVRSGWGGSDVSPQNMERQILPTTRVGQKQSWRDVAMHRERGHSSFLDLEVGECISRLTTLQDGSIECNTMLWYSDADYDRERMSLKSEFLPLSINMPDASDPDSKSPVHDGTDVPLSRLTAYIARGRIWRDRKKKEAEKASTDNNNQSALLAKAAFASPSLTRCGTSGGTMLEPVLGLDHFALHGMVGEGCFGKVMMVTKIDSHKVYAMKIISKELLFTKGGTSVQQAIAEKQVLQLMAANPHPYVVSLRYAFQNETNIFLVMVRTRRLRAQARHVRDSLALPSAHHTGSRRRRRPVFAPRSSR